MLPRFLDNPFQIHLSFHKLIAHLEKESAEKTDVAVSELLQEVALHPELREGITRIDQIENNASLISRLLQDLFPVLLSNNEIKAISIPYQGLIFNYSKRFHEILEAAGPDFEITIRNFDDHQFYVFSCCLILNRFYGTNVDFTKPLFYDIPTADGYIKHYRIVYNADFLEIVPIKETPALSAGDVKLLLDNYDDLALWKSKFPKETWLMKGFAMMTLIDVTIENAVSLLKGDLLGNSDDPDLHLKMESIFKSIFRVRDAKIGFTSYDELNGKFRNISFGQKTKSFILTGGKTDGSTRDFFEKTYHKLVNENAYYTIADVGEFIRENPGSVIGKNLESANVGSFILAPIVKNGSLLGFFELASPKSNDFNSVNANRLENVMPFLTDTVDRKVTEFKNRVQAVIQNNYTTLHPSVNWKFEREAYNFIHISDSGQGYNLKEIKFKEVYPLYGQVDVQNSSVTRNLSVKSDLENQLSELLLLFRSIKTGLKNEGCDLALAKLKRTADEVANGIKAGSEQEIQKWLDSELHPLLKKIAPGSSTDSADLDRYFQDTDRQKGAFYNHRRNYERTLSLINSTVTFIIDKRHEEIQSYFPHYYERFKTDGVEHNLYVGESIYPGHDFGLEVLERLRVWQLLVTVEMEMTQRQLKNTLPYPLGLTSLILVYSTAINIRFRMDEKHFDLDGAYDIRYEIVKKRIDKAHISGTDMRITEKEKLTIVYSKDEERKDYLKYIGILQQAGIFDDIIEDFEIEELQGVSGLRALRVGIKFDPAVLENFDDLYPASYNMLTDIPV